MLKLFGKYVIGGETGKREQAWFLFLGWCVGFVMMSARESAGLPVDATHSILTMSFPFVIINLALSHGLEWMSMQTDWGGARQ